MKNRVLKHDHRMQDYVGRDPDGYLSFYGVVRDNDAAVVEGAVVMLFACFNDGTETKLGYTLTNGEGAYFLCLPEMSDPTRLTGFKVRAGKAHIFPDEYGQRGEPIEEPSVDLEQNAAPEEVPEKECMPESEGNFEKATVDTFLVDTLFIDHGDANRQPLDENSNILELGSTLVFVTPTVQASTVIKNRPEVPTGLTAVAVGLKQINLSWNAVSGATSYNVYRSRSQAGLHTKVGTAQGNTFSDKGLMGATNYWYNWYKVTAVNSAGEGGFSTEVSVDCKAYRGPSFY